MLHAARDPANGYQLYDNIARQRLNFIIQARQLGFSIKEVKNIITHAEQGHSPCPMVRDLLQHKVKESEAKIIELQRAVDNMKKALADWQKKPDKQPDGHSICHLIESWNK